MNKTKVVILIGLIIGFAVITACFGAGNWLNWLIFLCVATSLIGFLYGHEGHWLTFLFSIISYGIYIPFCIMTKYYGELIVSILVIGVYTVTLFQWKRHTEKKVVKINKLSMREILICYAVFILATIILGFVLGAVNTEQPFINSLCLTSMIAGFYYAYRISRQEMVMMFINYVGYCALWIIAGIGEEHGFILLSVGSIIEMGYVVSSFFRWGKIYREQNTFCNSCQSGVQ
jgi:hypothetical protein